MRWSPPLDRPALSPDSQDSSGEITLEEIDAITDRTERPATGIYLWRGSARAGPTHPRSRGLRMLLSEVDEER